MKTYYIDKYDSYAVEYKNKNGICFMINSGFKTEQDALDWIQKNIQENGSKKKYCNDTSKLYITSKKVVNVSQTDLNTDVIIDLQEKYIKNPKRAVINPEEAFICDELQWNGYDKESKYYWSWCCGSHNDPIFSKNEIIVENHKKLKEIDAESIVPDWAHNGT